jgi:hypothetical protein
VEVTYSCNMSLICTYTTTHRKYVHIVFCTSYRWMSFNANLCSANTLASNYKSI